MRTPEEIDDLAFMRDENKWPNWPMLPVKRYTDRGGAPECGIVLSGKTTVYIAYMWGLKEDTFDTCKKYEYGSLDAILADGWVVD